MNHYISAFCIGAIAMIITGYSLAAEHDNVKITDFSYVPEVIEVNVGATISWTNKDNMPHTITADDGSWDSGRVKKNETYSHTFDKAGTFEYHCAYHASMKGSIIVSQ